MIEKIFKALGLEKALSGLLGYFEARIEQLKAEIRQEIEVVVRKLILYVLVGVFAILMLFFLSISLAGYLNTLFDSQFLGYLILAGINILLLIIILVIIQIRKPIEKKETEIEAYEAERD